jgi:hypothetical protein
VARLWERMEADPRRTLLMVLALTALLRVPFLGAPLQPDEGGFLMVATQWNDEGPALYGGQWVDRPPLLLVVFRLASMLGGSTVALRLLALCFGLTTVLAAWVAGRAINGVRGGIASAIVAAAISSSYVLDGFALTGESIAVPFVMSSCALTLLAAQSGRERWQAVGLALAAGVLASMAFLVKQNFVDAALFAAVLLSVAVRRTWRALLAGLVGVAVPLVVTAMWARSDDGPGLYKLWHALFRFRRRALDLMESASASVPVGRLVLLGVFFVVTGMVILTWQLLRAGRHAEAPAGLRLALVATLGYDVVSVLVGASWWTHYLLQLGPVLAMGTAMATRSPLIRLRTQLAAVVVTMTSVTASLGGVADAAAASPPGSSEVAVAGYLRNASKPGDSIVVVYGTPSIIEMAGLSTPYKYSWSLPVRARDPHLTNLVATLRGSSAPTWLLEMDDFTMWGLDTSAFRHVRAARYHVVATVCGHHLYLHDGLTRQLPPIPVCP